MLLVPILPQFHFDSFCVGRQVALLLSLFGRARPFFCFLLLFIFLLSLCLCALFYFTNQPPNYRTTRHFGQVGVLLSHFALVPQHLALGIWPRWSLGSSPFIVCCELVCRKAVYLFIYVSQGPTAKKRATMEVLFCSYLVRSWSSSFRA